MKLIELQKRIGELDTIFQRIYEDNITGKLSDERFMKMSKAMRMNSIPYRPRQTKFRMSFSRKKRKVLM